ncbi:ARM repeat superfamily protein [Striga hermonthica]|uniref:ARM repeat superfamily protein n=1 Tax=Striga hermonthica TaxID=68872 RepID=A0A9N7MX08_STRHE|nr:ARM repeat superfamily protein [Striga hermonthica]
MSNSPGEDEQGFACHPSAPPHESFDVSTTVDPSYVISLIRKLVPKTETPASETQAEAENCGDQSKCASAVERTWEECGCVLWDLAATEDHAQFMVQNLILDVLLANLVVPQSSRITEISLGIIGNLVCHEISRKQIALTNGLVQVIAEQLLLDDVPCLCEACSEGAIWAEVLLAEQTLTRIFWIAENALNSQLLEKIVGLLLAVLESQQKVAAILIPPMLGLGLSGLLIKLLAFEMTKLKEERVPDRYAVLDLVLRAIEALSTMDEYSKEICLNKELLQLIRDLIELPDKFEVASSCVTAAVLIANILTDAADLVSELAQDLNFLQCLFGVFPFASDDTEAQNAIWSTIARLLLFFEESEMTPSILHSLVSILARKFDLIEDELLFRPLDGGENKSVETSSTKINARHIAMKRISNILTRWKSANDGVKMTPRMGDCYVSDVVVDKLLNLLQ